MTEDAFAPVPGDRLGLILLARVNRIEARQRDYGMHDPDCAWRQYERDYGTPFPARPGAACPCWLQTPGPGGGSDGGGETPKQPGRAAGTGTDKEG